MVGVYIGYDKPKPLGRGMTGGVLAAPIVKDFMKVALEDKPAVPFRVPPGIKLVRVNLASGARAQPGDQRVILEAFKPGTAPPDNYAQVGYSDPNGGGGGYYPSSADGQRPWGAGVPADSDRAVRSGTGGLY